MPKDRKKPKKQERVEPVDMSTQLMTLTNKIDGLQNLLGNAMVQLQQINNRVNENWTKFVFHDHRRFDSAGPQYYNPEYEKAWMKEQERQDAAKKAAEPKAEEEGKPPESEET